MARIIRPWQVVVATSFVNHCHAERNHQSLDNQLIDPAQGVGHADGEIQLREWIRNDSKLDFVRDYPRYRELMAGSG